MLVHHVTTDIAPLQMVIVHKPDEGIEWVTPSNKDELLYDDIVYLPMMQHEHSLLVKTLEAFSGEKAVCDMHDLLAETMNVQKVKTELLEVLAALEGLSEVQVALLRALEPNTLASALIDGHIHLGEVVLEPVVNLIFTRDLGAMVGDHLLVCYACKPTRKRENVITWFVLRHHPAFSWHQANDKFLDLGGRESSQMLRCLQAGYMTIEGGDVIMLGHDNLLIACSERTNMKAILAIRDMAFERGVVNKLTVVDIPKEEYCMHVDTIFSQINTDDYVVYEKLMVDTSQVSVHQYVKGKSEPHQFDNFVKMLKAENPNARIFACGAGESPHDEREQWTMACNTVALKPGVVITYRRNTRTVALLASKGYTIVHAEDLLRSFESGEKTPDEIENTVITMPAGELSRGGGGPHCLTFPIARWA